MPFNLVIKNWVFRGFSAVALTAVCCSPSLGKDISGLEPGPVELKAAGPLTFADSGVLLVGDPQAATIYALNPDDSASGSTSTPSIDDLQQALAGLLNTKPDAISIGDLAVNPETGNAYLSVTAGDVVALVRVAGDGSLSRVNLDKIPHASQKLPNPPADELTGEGRRRRNNRRESITDLAFFDGKVIVSGLSAGDTPSNVLEIPYPFAENAIATNVEIFHAAHGRVEDAAIRTFVPMNVGGEPSLLAGFTCTPLVMFPINKMDGSEKVRGTTVAELGNRNQPLDMFVYTQDGNNYLLLSNSVRGVMKIATDDVENMQGLTERVAGGGTAGLAFEQIEALDGVVQMDKIDEERAMVVQRTEGNRLALRVVDLP